MKFSHTLLAGITLCTFSAGVAECASSVAGPLEINTAANADQLQADGGKIYVSSINVGSSSIAGPLSLAMKTRAGSITARDSGQVNIASVELRGVRTRRVSAILDSDIAGDVEALQGGRASITSAHMSNVDIKGAVDLDLRTALYGEVLVHGDESEVKVGSVGIESDSVNTITTYDPEPEYINESEPTGSNNPSSYSTNNLSRLPDVYDQHEYRLWDFSSKMGNIAALTDELLTSEKNINMYDDLYFAATDYRNLAIQAKWQYEKAVKDGNLDLAAIHKDKFYKFQNIYSAYDKAALDVLSGQLDSAHSKVRAVYDSSVLAAKVVAGVAVPGVGSHAVSLAADLLTYKVNKSDPDISDKAANQQLLMDFSLHLVTSFGPVHKVIDKQTGIFVGKSEILKNVASMGNNNEIRKEAMRIFHSLAKEEVNIVAELGIKEIEKMVNTIADTLWEESQQSRG